MSPIAVKQPNARVHPGTSKPSGPTDATGAAWAQQPDPAHLMSTGSTT